MCQISYVVPFTEDTPARLIEAVSPDVLGKGGDYAVTEIAGHEHVLAAGGEVIILDWRGTDDRNAVAHKRIVE